MLSRNSQPGDGRVIVVFDRVADSDEGAQKLVTRILAEADIVHGPHPMVIADTTTPGPGGHQLII